MSLLRVSDKKVTDGAGEGGDDHPPAAPEIVTPAAGNAGSGGVAGSNDTAIAA
jgi:hypothetical protein